MSLSLKRTLIVSSIVILNMTFLSACASPKQDSARDQSMSASNLLKLEQLLKNKPNDITVLVTLAQSYRQRRQYKKSATMYKKILSKIPKKYQQGVSFANFLATYADVLASSLQGKLDGEPIKLVFQALKVYPNHEMSLHLAGTYYFNVEDYEEALKYWEKLHTLLGKKPLYAKRIMEIIYIANQRLANER